MIFYNNLNMHKTFANLIRLNLWNDVSIVKNYYYKKKCVVYMHYVPKTLSELSCEI